MTAKLALRARLLELQAELQRRSIALSLARAGAVHVPPWWIAAGTAAASGLLPRRLRVIGYAWAGFKLLRSWRRSRKVQLGGC